MTSVITAALMVLSQSPGRTVRLALRLKGISKPPLSAFSVNGLRQADGLKKKPLK